MFLPDLRILQRRPRIKIYRDAATGLPKGDGLVIYLKEPSVDLACKLLDGTPFKYGAKQLMTVSPARFEQRGEFKVKSENKRARKHALESQKKRALGWSGFDDILKPQQV
jgi:HIV Tat-specific factor 1